MMQNNSTMDFLRQRSIISTRELGQVEITLIGAGGIGSPTALALAKMGAPRLTVYDPDSIEPHNLPNQFYRLDDIGRLKVDALAEIVRDYSGAAVLGIPRAFDETHAQRLHGIVISGVDSMQARKDIWEVVKSREEQVDLYIEARMGAEVARVYSLDPSCEAHRTRYEGTLYSDEEGVSEPCGAQSIIYCTFMIASLIAAQVKKFVKDETYHSEVVFDLVNTISLADLWGDPDAMEELMNYGDSIDQQ